MCPCARQRQHVLIDRQAQLHFQTRTSLNLLVTELSSSFPVELVSGTLEAVFKLGDQFDQLPATLNLPVARTHLEPNAFGPVSASSRPLHLIAQLALHCSPVVPYYINSFFPRLTHFHFWTGSVSIVIYCSFLPLSCLSFSLCFSLGIPQQNTCVLPVSYNHVHAREDPYLFC